MTKGLSSSTAGRAPDERVRAGLAAIGLAVTALETAIGLLSPGRERETAEMCRDVLLGLHPPRPGAPRRPS